MSHKTSKIYKSIGEVAKILNLVNEKKGTLNTHTIRFWEKEFKQIQPKKKTSGIRKFTPGDIENIQLIHHLLKEKGMTIEGAKNQLTQSQDSEKSKLKLLNRLNKIKEELTALRDNL